MELAEALKSVFRDDPRGGAAKGLLEAYARDCDDWRDWAMFEEDCYTRNLVDKCEHFELLLLCWNTAQASPIHNHEGENCWAAVLDGPLEELRYDWSEGQVPAVQDEVMRFERGQVSFIRDEMGLHVVRAGTGKPAVSLHLYARPFSECNIYCPETGRVTRKRLAYHSVRGERAGG
jgi:cysteine dioxygenase